MSEEQVKNREKLQQVYDKLVSYRKFDVNAMSPTEFAAVAEQAKEIFLILNNSSPMFGRH